MLCTHIFFTHIRAARHGGFNNPLCARRKVIGRKPCNSAAADIRADQLLNIFGGYSVFVKHRRRNARAYFQKSQKQMLAAHIGVTQLFGRAYSLI